MNRLCELYDGIESVEIPIKSTTDTKYYLPNIPRLKGKIIKRIEIPHGITTTPGNRDILSISNIRAGFLTIVNEKDIVIHRLPLYFLKKQFLSAPILNFVFNFKLADTEKSYIEFAQSASLVTTESIFINFFYTDPDKKRKLSMPLINNSLIDSAFERNIIENVYPVQIEVPDITSTILKFPDDEFLRNKKVISVKLFADVSELVSASIYSPDNKQMISATIFNKSFLNLQLKNGNKISDLPMPLITSEFHLENEIYFNDIVIDWPKSFIKIANNTSLAANTVFYFLIHYYNEN